MKNVEIFPRVLDKQNIKLNHPNEEAGGGDKDGDDEGQSSGIIVFKKFD